MFKRNRNLIKDILTDKQLISTNITVCGWINNFRVQKNNGISFITLSDGSSLTELQIIVDPKTPEETEKFKTIYEKGTKGVSLKVYGTLVESPMSGQEVELRAIDIDIYGDVDASKYPISKTKLTLEHLRKYPHLRIRTKTHASIARIRNI